MLSFLYFLRILILLNFYTLLKNDCREGKDEPDQPYLWMWRLPGLLWAHCLALFTYNAHTYTHICRQMLCCLLSPRWVSGSMRGWPDSCFCRRLLKSVRSFAFVISRSGFSHLRALNVPGFIFSRSFPECFGLQFLSIYLLSMFFCFQGFLIVSNQWRILFLIWQNICGFLFKNLFSCYFHGFGKETGAIAWLVYCPDSTFPTIIYTT